MKELVSIQDVASKFGLDPEIVHDTCNVYKLDFIGSTQVLDNFVVNEIKNGNLSPDTIANNVYNRVASAIGKEALNGHVLKYVKRESPTFSCNDGITFRTILPYVEYPQGSLSLYDCAMREKGYYRINATEDFGKFVRGELNEKDVR